MPSFFTCLLLQERLAQDVHSGSSVLPLDEWSVSERILSVLGVHGGPSSLPSGHCWFFIPDAGIFLRGVSQEVSSGSVWSVFALKLFKLNLSWFVLKCDRNQAASASWAARVWCCQECPGSHLCTDTGLVDKKELWSALFLSGWCYSFSDLFFFLTGLDSTFLLFYRASRFSSSSSCFIWRR